MTETPLLLLYVTVNNQNEKDKLEDFLNKSILEYSIYSHNKNSIIYKLESLLLLNNLELAENYVKTLYALLNEFEYLNPIVESEKLDG